MLFFRNNIIVGITTTPRRINDIIPTLDSIVNQSVKADKIILSLSYEIARTGDKFGQLPHKLLEYIKCNKSIEIIRIPDYGPATKFVGLLLTQPKPKTYLVWFDDDVIYNKHAIKILVKHVSKTKHSVACTSMIEVTSEKCIGLKKFAKLSKNKFYVFDGYAGVCCRFGDMPDVSNFPLCSREDYNLMTNEDRFKFNTENFMLSYYLYQNNINFILVEATTCDTIRDVGMSVDALHNVQDQTSVYKYLYNTMKI